MNALALLHLSYNMISLVERQYPSSAAQKVPQAEYSSPRLHDQRHSLSFHLYSDPLSPQARNWHEAITRHFNRVSFRLKELEIYPCKERCNTNVQLCICKIQAETHPRTFAKRHEIARQRFSRRWSYRVFQPSFGFETMWVFKDALIAMHQVSAHTDRCAPWNPVRGVEYFGFVVFASEALGYTVRHTEC